MPVFPCRMCGTPRVPSLDGQLLPCEPCSRPGGSKAEEPSHRIEHVRDIYAVACSRPVPYMKGLGGLCTRWAKYRIDGRLCCTAHASPFLRCCVSACDDLHGWPEPEPEPDETPESDVDFELRTRTIITVDGDPIGELVDDDSPGGLQRLSQPQQPQTRR